jgi:hypothetical protein
MAMDRQPSARFMLRMPASLREQLGLAAASEGVSMNQFACGVIAAAVQWQSRPEMRRYPNTKEELMDELWSEILR